MNSLALNSSSAHHPQPYNELDFSSTTNFISILKIIKKLVMVKIFHLEPIIIVVGNSISEKHKIANLWVIDNLKHKLT